MTEETQVFDQADLPAPELEATAAPDSVDNQTPEDVADDAPKTFSQEDLDKAISKRLAREQRKWEREQTQRAADQVRSAPADMPSPEYFDTTEAYADALAERKAEELLARREAAQQQSSVLEAYHDREEEARNKYDDFEQVAYNPNLKITDVMAQSIQYSDVGPDIAYHLGTNPKEADRISKLPPILQAKEIGKIEANLANNPPVKRSSSAPAPIAPVTARSSGSPAYDTTDPRSTKTMSDSQWIEAERLRQIKKYEAQRNR
jgi:hypothetical protein